MSTRPTHVVCAGLAIAYDVQLYDGATPPAKFVGRFTGSEPLVCQVWPGDSQAVTFTPTATWDATTGPLGIVGVAYSAAQTASITPGFYEGRIYLADLSACLAIFDVNLTSSPGTATPDLITMPFARAALSSVDFSNAELEFLPSAVGIASDSVRQWCNRYFTRRTLTREYLPSYDGRILLPEFPVNGILRVATDLTTALTITASASANQSARVYFSTTGDRIGGLTVTGLTLTRTASGTTTTNTLLFATYTSVTALAAAINALSTWTATVEGDLGAWPTSELIGGDRSQGALQDGAVLGVYATDTSDYSFEWQTGMLALGRTSSNAGMSNPYLWPGLDTTSTRRQPARVQVTHDLGFAVVPASVQHACALMAKDAIRLNSVDNTVQTEKLSEYSYSISTLVVAMSNETRQLLKPYKILDA